MQLPPPDMLPSLPHKMLLSASDARVVDKAIVDKAATLHILEKLPQILDNAYTLSSSAESESVQADMTKYLLDRVAGKPVERSQATSLNVNVVASADEVNKRLNNLLNLSSYGENA